MATSCVISSFVKFPSFHLCEEVGREKNWPDRKYPESSAANYLSAADDYFRPEDGSLFFFRVDSVCPNDGSYHRVEACVNLGANPPSVSEMRNHVAIKGGSP